ncbi:hypothetical protein [Nonomuraea gerenzanensis]|uniref:Secreted protein n=1 Tax=Nonomuraea gerenzanensis TaxID=93944 RepID=A0A1M4E0W6_9ACTN|nr:hypothetical protein [Nonomuraea gerenzanensis]UBU14703.1 hypothetical protein LCN96_06670 [Nonomuraea gerenzanensis]SBO92428.1 hypothetical protein BN4615_P1942 [Nonomuraea gerenzanensis]
MWITLAAASAMAVTLAAAPVACAPAGNSTTHPAGEHGCQNAWGPLVAVQFAPAKPKVRASLRVKCDKELITTFMARIAIEHKDGLFADWYEIKHDYYEQLPGLASSYTLLSDPCREGSYRAKASITGTFMNGEPFKVTEETPSTTVDCEHPEPIT